jgi:hypothetical protein
MKIALMAFFIVLLVLFSCLLCGCSASRVTEVKIPVPVSGAKIELTPKPYLPIWSLKKDSTPAEVMKAWVTSCQILNDDDDENRMKIQGSQ